GQLHLVEEYQESEIDLINGEKVKSIDPSTMTVDGSDAEYRADKIVVATGARAVRPPIPGVDKPGVCFLRNIDDLVRLQDALTTADAVTIVGVGFLGHELAATLTTLGKKVTILEAASALLGGRFPQLSTMLSTMHHERENTIELGTAISGIG